MNEQILDLFKGKDVEVIGFRSGKNHPWRRATSKENRPPFNWSDPDNVLASARAMNNLGGATGCMLRVLRFNESMRKFPVEIPNEQIIKVFK